MKVDADRAAGALLGLAAGDALGAGYEFTTPAAGAAIGMVGGGGFGWEPGEWTDDTQMALCIAQVTSAGVIALGAIGEAFLAWLRAGQKDVGNQTRAVLGAASSAADLAAVAAAHFGRNPKGGAGNGSLMRTAPVALACLGDDELLRSQPAAVSALTHGDPLAGEACVLWCVAIDRAVREGRLDGVRDGLGLLDPDRRAFWASALDQAEGEQPGHFGRGNGFVVTALQAAWSAIWHTRESEDATHLARALETAVRIGGDTDTVAAIAGQVLGARYGASAVPWHWRRVLHGWPGLRAADLVRLAVLTARRGGVSARDWPLAESLLAVEHHGERAFCNAVADDADLLVGNLPGVALALDRSVGAVVSLCRVGSADVPSRVEHVTQWLVDNAGPEHNPNLDFVLADALDAVRTLRAEGKRVYLHCVGGRSRTATVAAAYLAQHLGISGPDALARLGPALPEAAPNPRFLAHVQAIAAPTPPPDSGGGTGR